MLHQGQVYSASRDIESGDEDYETEEQLLTLRDGSRIAAFPGVPRHGYRNLYQMRDETFTRIGVLVDDGTVLLNQGKTAWEVFFQDDRFRKRDEPFAIDEIFGSLQLEVFAQFCANYDAPKSILDNCSVVFLDDPMTCRGAYSGKPVVFLEDGQVVLYDGKAVCVPSGSILQWLTRTDSGQA